MIVFDRPEEVKALLVSEGMPVDGSAQYIGWVKDGKMLAGAGYRDYREDQIEACLALPSRQISRAFLFCFLAYPFAQLKVRRLTFAIAASNLKSINFVSKLGAHREATLQDGSPDGDAYIYCLRPEGCSLWRKLCRL